MQAEMDFRGATYDPALDRARLGSLLDRVRDLMLDGRWRTLAEIAHEVGSRAEASVSARLRDLRRPERGGYAVEHRRRGDPKAGLWEYRMASKAMR